MEKLPMCRVCLVQNVRMLKVTDTHLQETFEKLTDILFLTSDRRPTLACFFCYARLKQCSQFMMKCFEAEQAFNQILNEDFELKPLASRGDYFSSFIRTSIENINIVDGAHEVETVKEELPFNNDTEEDVHAEETDDSDGSPVEKKHKPEDSNLNKRKEHGQANLKDTDKSTSNNNETVSKLTEPGHMEIGVLEHSPGKSYVCEICQKSFNFRINLVNHIQIHTGEKPFKCDLCHLSFKRKINLNTHIRTHTIEKVYNCEICHISFSHKSGLFEHNNRTHGKKPYNCDKCQKSFKRNRDLRGHIRTHTGETSFNCDICHRGFSHRNNFIIHIRTHTGEKPYKCDMCPRGFANRSNLITHIRTHTGEKPYKCNICQRTYTRKCGLLRHIRTHTGEKPFNCNVCLRSFSHQSYLQRHNIRKHTGNKKLSSK